MANEFVVKNGLISPNVQLQGSTSGSVTIAAPAVAGTTSITLPSTAGTLVTTGDTGTVTNTMLAGSIANAKLVNSAVTVGSTSISLGASSTTLAGLTSVTSTSFVGALTGNASTATTLQTARTIALSGDVAGSVSFDGSANATISATIQPDSVALGTDTTGNYMVNVSAGTGVTVSHTPAEGSTATVSIGQAVGTTDNVTFNNVTVNGTLTSDDITSASISVAGNATITGNLTVSGTTTTINSTTIAIADLNLELARNATTATQANGAGITVTGPVTAATLTYSSTDDRWNFNKNLNITRVYGTATNVSNVHTAGSYLTGGTFDGSSAVTWAVDATPSNTASKVVARDASGNFSASTITAALSGNASTASSWQTARTLSYTGDATGSLSVDGSTNVSTALTLAASGVTAGTYNNVTVNSKGLVTSGSNVAYLTAESDTLATVTARGATTSSQITVDSVITTNNGNGTNIRLGDDVWIGDVNLANTFRIRGNQDAAQGYITFGSDNTQFGRNGTGALTWGGNTVWHAGNLTNLNQLTNGPGYITGYTETDTLASVTGRGFTSRASSGTFATATQGTPGLEIYGGGTTEPAYMTFHRPGVYAVRFGLDGSDLKVGGWSMGAVSYKMWHEGNLTNLNQLTNGPGYITGYTETDTLASVTARGATTSTLVRINNQLRVGQNTNGTAYIDAYDGYAWFGRDSNTAGVRIDSSGNVHATAQLSTGSYARLGGGTSNPTSTTFSHTLAGVSTNRIVNFDGNGNGAPSVWWTSGSRAYGAIDAKDPGLTFWANNGTSWQQQFEINYGNVTVNTDIRSPVFYDSDTTYYADLNSTSWGVYSAGGGRFRNIQISSSTYTDTIQHVTSGGVLWLQYGHSGNVGLVYGGGAVGVGAITPTSGDKMEIAGNLRVHTGNNWDGVQIRADGANGYIQGLGDETGLHVRSEYGNIYIADNRGDVRMPMFYDVNDTGYYVDPNSGTRLNSLTINDGNVQLYKSQTIDMSNTSVYSTSNYYPVIMGVPTSGVWIEIQNNLNSNVPSWATHGGGFTLNLRWWTNGSGWGTTEIKRRVEQYHERFTNSTICGGITQMGNGSVEVVWLRGGGTYYFKFSRDISASAQSSTYTNNGQSVSPTSSAQNSVWNSASGSHTSYNTNVYSGAFYDWDDTGYYLDPNYSSGTSLKIAGGISTPLMWVNYSTSNYNDYNEGIRLYAANNGAAVITFNSGGTGGSSYGSILGFTDRLEQRWAGSWQERLYNGYMEASGSYRAPIFYDSNDTGYYIDPNSTSATALRIRGGTLHGPNPTWGKYLYVGGNGDYDSGQAQIFTTNGNLHLESASGNSIYLNNYRGGFFYAGGMYDNNDSAYYVDPNSVSRFAKLAIGANSYISGMQWGTLSLGDTGTNYNYTSGWSGSMQAGILANCSDNWEFVIHDSGHRLASPFVFWGAGSNYFEMGRDIGWGTSYVQASQSFRAPIFYDSNDTNYYLDPGNYSRLLFTSVYLGNESTGAANSSSDGLILRGNYNSNSWAHKFHKYDNGGGVPLYLSATVGAGSWSPRQAWGNGLNYTSQVFGSFAADDALYSPIFYDKDNTGTYINPNGSSIINSGGGYPMEFRSTQRYISRFWNQNVSGYGFWLANDANTLVFHADSVGDKASLDSSGNFIAYGSSRAPIFYDYNDTSYYTDPSSYSQLRHLTLGRYNDPLGYTGGYYDINFYGYRDVGQDYYGAKIRGQRGNSCCGSGAPYLCQGVYLQFYTFQGCASGNGDSNLGLRATFDNDVSFTGNVTAYASDRRLKTNIRPIENAMDKVNQLTGFTYNWNELAKELAEFDTQKNQVGVFAQEVEEILPEVVELAPFDTDHENGKVSKSGENYLTVQYERLVPLLIQALKEQDKRMNEQDKRIRELEKKLNDQ